MINKYLKDSSWKESLKDEFKKEYFKELSAFVENEYENKTIFPRKEDIFNAFNKCPLDKVKVVIIGQDPYHGVGQAHGLCFSVLKPTKIPPSLRNIFKEINSDLKIDFNVNGNLEQWANEGVFLLNSILTVAEGKPMSHHKKGWERFTEKVIEILNTKSTNLVFMAWGSPAHEKIKHVDEKKHLVLKTVHPSPLSAYRGFLGCGHFSKCNEFLKSKKIQPINWKIN